MSAAGENHVGLDADLHHGHGDTMFLNGPYPGWAGGKPTPAPEAKRWHNITLMRVKGVLSVSVDGRTAFRVRVSTLLLVHCSTQSHTMF